MITAALVKELRQLTGAGMMDCKKALQATDGDIQAAVKWLQEKGMASAAKKAGRIAAEGLAKVVAKDNLAAIYEVNAETDFVAKNEQFLDLVDMIGAGLITFQPASLEEANNLVLDGKTLAEHVMDATATIGEKISFRRFELVEKNDDEVFGLYMHMGGKIAGVAVVETSDEEVARDMAMQVVSMSPQYVSSDHMPQAVIDEQTHLQEEILKNDPVLSEKNEKQKAGIIRGRVSKALQEISLVDQPYFKDQNMKVSQFLQQEKASVSKFVRYAVGEGIEKREDDFAAEVAAMAK